MISVYYLENKCKSCENPMQLVLTSDFDWQPECMVCLKKHPKTYPDPSKAYLDGFQLKKHNSLKPNS